MTVSDLSAAHFSARLKLHQSDDELHKIVRYFNTGDNGYGASDEFMGVRMGTVFNLAKEFIQMPLSEIETLLDDPVHEVRAGAVSIMDFQARSSKFSKDRKKELFDLYIRRHDRINNWDLVDRAAPHVVGSYLIDKPRDILYQLARTGNLWERRTAIVCTWVFIRLGDLDDTFAIAEILIHNPEDILHKAIGSWLRTAGGKDRKRLNDFLKHHAATMPRVALRYAIEHFEKGERDYYLSLKSNTA
jgi:3-methyladenine DNA glycosylase AlkD